MNIEMIPIIHRYIVPTLHTLVWALGLVLSIFSNALFSRVSLSTEHEVISWAFWSVYVIFVFEYLIVIFDQKTVHRKARFKANVLWLFMKFVFVTAGVVLSWLLYEKMEYADALNPYLLSMIVFACLQKKQEVSFSNNAEKYLDTNYVNRLQTTAA